MANSIILSMVNNTRFDGIEGASATMRIGSALSPEYVNLVVSNDEIYVWAEVYTSSGSPLERIGLYCGVECDEWTIRRVLIRAIEKGCDFYNKRRTCPLEVAISDQDSLFNLFAEHFYRRYKVLRRKNNLDHAQA